MLCVKVMFLVHHSKIKFIFLLKPGIDIMKYLSQKIRTKTNSAETSEHLHYTSVLIPNSFRGERLQLFKPLKGV